ncbi:hypothetical protein MATL_G00035590 [Megalops atlanticus]|uniref:Uncharacterized protein n=1 Tax=Megalops atlanticus TaxID=7932 RepID=A0A9D3QDK1_MEGAT|nr:hypothetical protein MATL_G00035590 [Megalops atlanticus]
MFALLSNLKELNQTDKLDPPAELGSGAAGQEESSGAGPSVQEAWPEATPPRPASATPSSPTPTPTPSPAEKKLESKNDIPERPPAGAAGQRRGPPRDTWARQLEEGLDGDGLAFSGNGFTELETRHDFLLRSSSSGPQGDLPTPRARGAEEEEDIFQAQGYLPLSPQTVRPATRAGEGGPIQTDAPRSGTGVPPGPRSHDPSDSEGSGSAPPPSTTN